MRKLWLVVGVVAAVVLPAAPIVAAEDLLFGEQQSYSVTMRGNGEAVVTARVVFNNSSDKDKTGFDFEVPKLAVSEMVGFQQHIQTACQDYGDIKPLGNGTTQLQSSASSAAGASSAAVLPRPCLKYAEPDYASPVYGTTSTYDKLTIKALGGGKYHAELPKAVPVGQSGALLLSYAGKGYAASQLGAYKLDFQTLKVGERIKHATVALDVDSGLYLLDGKSKVSYSSSNVSKSAAPLQAGAAASTRELDSLSQSVGSGGSLSEEASDLAPGDVLNVRGTYADATWKLHPVRLVLLLVVALAALVGLAWLLAWLKRRLAQRAALAASMPAAVKKPMAAKVAATAPIEAPRGVAVLDPLAIVLGLGSALGLAAMTWAGLVYAQTSENDDPFITVLGSILVILVYALLVVGPLVWLGLRRHDWRSAVYTLLWQAVWVVFVLVVYGVGIKPLINDQPTRVEPYYGIESGAVDSTTTTKR
jgi:hypothetical protein